MKTYTFLTLCFLAFSISVFGQNGGVGIGTLTPNPKSILDITSIDKGLLIPRLSETQRDLLQTPGSSNPNINGLLIYNTNTNKVNIWNSTKWEELGTGIKGDIGLKGNDGATWYNGTLNPPVSTSEPSGSKTGDLYLNNSTGIVYKRQSNGNWVSVANLTTGIQGPQGPQGAPGVQGPAGPTGATGPQGLTGATGPQGPIGLTGAVGPAGPIGATGPAGAIGLTGPEGPMGLTGPAGIQGPQGIPGIQGPPGDPGEQGPAGPQGPSGSSSAWLRTGNGAGNIGGTTTPGTGVGNDFLGTTDAKEVIIAANRNEGIRIQTNGKVRIGAGGSDLTRIHKKSETVDLPAIASGTSRKQHFTINGLSITAAVSVSVNMELPDGLLIAYARVISVNTVEVKFINVSSTTIDLPPAEFYLSAIE